MTSDMDKRIEYYGIACAAIEKSMDVLSTRFNFSLTERTLIYVTLAQATTSMVNVESHPEWMTDD